VYRKRMRKGSLHKMYKSALTLNYSPSSAATASSSAVAAPTTTSLISCVVLVKVDALGVVFITDIVILYTFTYLPVAVIEAADIARLAFGVTAVALGVITFAVSIHTAAR
jgi:hypothetical protein